MFKKTSVIYSLSAVFKSGVQMLVGLAIAKFVSPEDYGIWGALNLLLTYAIILQLGTINGVNLELPIAMGEKNDEKAKSIIQTSQTYILGCMFVIFVIGILYLLIFGKSLSPKFFWGVAALIVMISFTFYQDFLTATFRTPLSFKKFSYINIIQAIVNFATILLILYFSFYGLIIKSVLVIVLYVIMLHFYRPFKVEFRFDKRRWLELVKVGLPIFILSYIQVSALSFDRLLLLKFANLTEVGIYTFAYLAFSSVTLLSSSVASYIYPIMSHMYAESRDKKQLWIYLKKNITYIFFALLVIGSLGALFVPSVIESFFPNYTSSVDIMQILFFAGVFNGGVIGVNVLLSIKKWRLIIFYHLFFAILLLVCPFVMMKIYTNKMEGIAYGVLIANVLNFISAYLLVYIALVKKEKGDGE